MYINPFWVGVVATLGVEFVAIIILTIVLIGKKK